MRDIIFNVSFVAMITVIIYGYLFMRRRTFRITRTSIAQQVREIPIQLVTNKTTTMVYCTFDDIPEGKFPSFWDFFGKTESVLITKVTYLYGLDFKKDFGEDNIIVGPDNIIITLPEPKSIINAPDLDYKIITKTKVLRALVNSIANVDVEREMRILFQQSMERFAEENGLKPTKEEIIKNIVTYFNKIIGDKTGKHIIFK